KDAISKTNARLFSSWIQPLGGVENIHRAGLDRTAAAQDANPAFRQADTAFAPRRYRVQYLATARPLLKFVVQADAQHVVGDTRAIVAGERAAAKSCDGGGERSGGAAEIDIEIFEPGGPVAADCAFDAGADGVANAQVIGGEAGTRDRLAVVDVAVSQAAGGV